MKIVNQLTDSKLPSSLLDPILKLLTTSTLSPSSLWHKITQDFFIPETPVFAKYPFSFQSSLYKALSNLQREEGPLPGAFPTKKEIESSNISLLMKTNNFKYYSDLHRWSIESYPEFWQTMIETLDIVFDTPYTEIVSLEKGMEDPEWFPNSTLNIINSCFNADPNAIAMIAQNEEGKITKFTFSELERYSNRIAHSLLKHFKPAACLAIIMPMTLDAVAIYLGIIKAGCTVVSIADSFSADEISIRLKISNTKGIFTQNFFIREGKQILLYEKLKTANPHMMIVLPENAEETTEKKNKKNNETTLSLRSEDLLWQDFLRENDNFISISSSPSQPINILFSSGTTGDPKAIPWDHTTPIKCSADAYLHHNVQRNDRFCWPTNLGWMMGPWLIFAALINKATIALYEGSPLGAKFGKFIQDHNITHLGVVPTLVKSWRNSACMESFDWSSIKVFSSSGECSNEEDMLYLMALAHYRPIIEYCGGTEIGGGYISSTVIEPNAPASFTTSTLGLGFVILDEAYQPANKGEVALVPPSIGLSKTLLNKNHHEVYFRGMPIFDLIPLRRHGDEIEKYPNGFYRIQGRVDDTMNLGGIKVSAAEIERVLNNHAGVFETAAIAISPEGGGPSLLVIYAVLREKKALSPADKEHFKTELQMLIKQHLNPLFKIYDVIFCDNLPRTASNKMMRRVLRDQFKKSTLGSPLK